MNETRMSTLQQEELHLMLLNRIHKHILLPPRELVVTHSIDCTQLERKLFPDRCNLVNHLFEKLNSLSSLRNVPEHPYTSLSVSRELFHYNPCIISCET